MHLLMQLSVFNIGRILRELIYSIKAYANLPHLNERKKYLLSVKNCLCQNRNMFPTCRGNVVHTTASLPHFTVPTGARLCGVWGGLCPPLSSPGRLYLATFANLVADRTAVCLTQVFALPQCACGNPLPSLPHVTTRPRNILRHKSYSIQTLLSPQDYRILF